MTQAELETIFDALAQGIDQAGEASEIFLAKVCLALAKDIDKADRVLDILAKAEANLDAD
jgi:hypothetical protein